MKMKIKSNYIVSHGAGLNIPASALVPGLSLGNTRSFQETNQIQPIPFHEIYH